MGCLHLCERHCHSVVFGERPDARLVPPGGVTVAIRLRLLVICCFHGSREITYDAIEIHNCRLGDIQLEPGERHAFQDSVAGSIRWESDRYTGPRTTAAPRRPGARHHPRAFPRRWDRAPSCSDPSPDPTAAEPGDGRVRSRPSSRVHEPCTFTEAVALRSQTVLTGSGSYRISYGGFGGGHPHFHPHVGTPSSPAVHRGLVLILLRFSGVARQMASR